MDSYNKDLHGAAEHKELHEAISAGEEKWQKLFMILPVGVTILDKERKIVDINPAIERILSIDKKGLRAGAHKNRVYLRSDGTVMPPDEFPSLRAIKEQKIIEHVEIGVVKEDGSTVWTDVSAAPLSLSDAACVVVTADISYHKKMERMLETRIDETEKLNAIMVDRELKMIELKKEIEDLKLRLAKN